MILVDEIESFDGTVTKLSEIQSLYYNQINRAGNGDNIDKIVSDSVLTGKIIIDSKGTIYNLNPNEKAFLTYIETNLQNILDGTILELLDHIQTIERNPNFLATLYETDGKLNDFSKKVLKVIFDYKRFRNSKKKSGWFCRKINIKACPFCNNQYTLVANRKGPKQDLSFTLDHFFPKSKYPYLAISMYNLVPCCGSCNQKKSDSVVDVSLDFHPYHSSLHESTYFKVDLPDNIHKMNAIDLEKEPEKSFKIKYATRYKQTEDLFKKHDNTFNITGLYERHSDIAKRLVYLSNQYSKNGTNIHKALGLVTSKKSALEYLLGNYLNEHEINKRPLSKLTIDIATKFKLL